MTSYMYDGSFDGLLSLVFASFLKKTVPDTIERKLHDQPSLSGTTFEIATNPVHASRVLEGLRRKSSPEAVNTVWMVFHSDIQNMELLILQYIRYLMYSEGNVESNFTNPFVLKMNQVKKQVSREVHRMHAFVRFEKTREGTYVSCIEPDFNILALIAVHFEKRFADQSWIIFDAKRNRGILYDLKTLHNISLLEHQTQENSSNHPPEPREEIYRSLWKKYYQSVNISERKNLKFHLQQLPRRYWKYLPEKSGR